MENNEGGKRKFSRGGTNPPPRRRALPTQAQLDAALDAIEEGKMHYREIREQFGISIGTLSRKVRYPKLFL